ncbi:LuxR family transcriptional regulator [Lentzea aerocolonigenes]|uniref:LuxR family transcriptional regulator n=1 Tax=Lentzea aerocolonigenes TaxID=68170 RepID=A0A0F0H842_LENAE|nr:LuxR C-terminal-related transcriptional regulator [Lentzea aerocolonigenes]KJK50477.1 LuxR family transcriptional regulator [Lentzea aerocolonigenes]
MTTTPATSTNLPATLTSFVGRQRDLAEVRRLVRTVRLVTVTGVGGVGKSRLALRVAELSSDFFPDGVWLVDLASVWDPRLVAATAAAALGQPDLGTKPVLDVLTGRLARHRALVVLDNCEHLAEASAELVARLLAACPGLRVLATSRRILRVVGEHVHTLGPLPADSQAVELLRDRVVAVRPGFRVTEANRAQAVRLCVELDGLPLAVELAAARLRSLTLEQVVERLEDRFALLTGGTTPRQHSLIGTVEWSYELCTAAERLLWNRLSVFPGGFGLDAAEEVGAGEGIATHEVLDLLDRLVAQSVVFTCDRDGLPRYRLPEVLREYGAIRLAESGELRRVLRRHCEFFLGLAERLALRWYGPGQPEALARLRAEHANLRLALEQPHCPQGALALAAALRFHWFANGFLGEGRRHLHRLLAAAPEPTPARARALCTAAHLALLQSDLTVALPLLDEAERLGVQAGVQGLRGFAALLVDRPREALAHYRNALDLLTSVGDTSEQVFWLFQMTITQARLADPRAIDTGRRAVAIARAHGERLCQSYASWALGRALWMNGDREQALARTREALAILRDFNDYIVTAGALDLLAWDAAARGAHERSALLLGAVNALFQATGFAPLSDDHARCADTVAAALGHKAYERALAEGGRHDSPAQAIDFALGLDKAAPAGRAESLTRREREVCGLLAGGLTNRQIAAALSLSPRTADRHVENIMSKLGFRRRTQIAAWWEQQRAA